MPYSVCLAQDARDTTGLNGSSIFWSLGGSRRNSRFNGHIWPRLNRLVSRRRSHVSLGTGRTRARGGSRPEHVAHGKGSMDPTHPTSGENLEVMPLVVVSQTFPARPSSIPDIRDFVRRCLASAALNDEDTRAIGATVSKALLEAAGPTGTIQVSFRIFPDHVEVDVLRSHPQLGTSAPVESLVPFLQPGGAPAVAGDGDGG